MVCFAVLVISWDFGCSSHSSFSLSSRSFELLKNSNWHVKWPVLRWRPAAPSRLTIIACFFWSIQLSNWAAGIQKRILCVVFNIFLENVLYSFLFFYYRYTRLRHVGIYHRSEVWRLSWPENAEIINFFKFHCFQNLWKPSLVFGNFFCLWKLTHFQMRPDYS